MAGPVLHHSGRRQAVNFSHRQIVSLQKRQRGLALVMVLWLVMLLSIIASGHTYNVHIETRLAAAHVQKAKARASVEAGLSFAILQLLTTNTANAWPIDGTVGQFRFADTEVLGTTLVIGFVPSNIPITKSKFSSTMSFTSLNN